ncbi:hypothetical protein [Homoserinibacter sp. YIM 151385]|uniref:hypothetical protein n=1 Tax=Homoserinibacter sp. YIM 151385 TaxID=2985506 RepID=UPI0022F02BC5|nr:hypothetical protein [Homoserinibacter sp. YIM 151385]WBU37772.1 hypothetical protein OF852_12760 [Homoserinibacter sp. YIM 151385]
MPAPENSKTPTPSRTALRLGTAAAAVLAIAATAIHLWMASTASIPVLWTDELGYLANAQILSGVGEPRDLAGRGYYVGWALLLVPLWWITNDLELLYRIAVGISAVLGIAVMLPSALIARRMGLGWRWSVALAAVVSLAPARTSMSSFALAENLLTLLIAFTVLAAMRFGASRSLRDGVLLGAAAAAVFVTHGRAVPIAIAVGLWLLWELRRHWRAALAGGVVLAAMSAGGFLLYRWTISFLYPPSADREATGIDRIFFSPPAAVVTSGTGQVWYEFAAWGGLCVLGGILLGRGVIRELRAREVGVSIVSAVALIGVFVVSATWVSRVVAAGRDRLDIYSYGRYLESYGVLLALFGLILLVKGISWRAGITAIAASVVISAVFFLFIAPQAPLDGILFWGATSVPGLLQYPWPNTSSRLVPPWPWAGGFAMAAIVATVLLRKRPQIVVAVAAIFFAASSVVAGVRTLDPYFAGFRASFGLREELHELVDHTVAFDTDGMNEPGMVRDAVSRNAYQYWTSPRASEVFDSDEGIPDVELVIARKEWANGEAAGARKLADDTGLFDNALWVMPGALQDELDARGRLG